MDQSFLFSIVGFLLAAYAVIANDSIQTLGTFISSNKARSWTLQWVAASSVLVGVLCYSWYFYDGDISYGRLSKIPLPATLGWQFIIPPLGLLVLTRLGFPVSTTFLVLSAFASNVVLEKMIIKSVLGYAIAGVVAYVSWALLSKWLDEHRDVPESHKKFWRVAQWLSTGFLWSQWLAHDVANIAVYLPRQLNWQYLVMVNGVFVLGLLIIFYHRGGKIQQVILNKSGTRYVRSATIIDFVYGCILLFFKNYSQIPMSTTWVFVGLLCGREVAVYHLHKPKKHIKTVFPVLLGDFFKIVVGLAVSVIIAWLIHWEM